MSRAPKDTDILVRFGRRVRALRKDRTMSQEDLALECDLDRTYVSGIERGKRNVALVNIEAIAKTLDVTLSELFQGIEQKDTP
jgi:transcriptional regulator with XRE-family HTH domain